MEQLHKAVHNYKLQIEANTSKSLCALALK